MADQEEGLDIEELASCMEFGALEDESQLPAFREHLAGCKVCAVDVNFMFQEARSSTGASWGIPDPPASLDEFLQAWVTRNKVQDTLRKIMWQRIHTHQLQVAIRRLLRLQANILFSLAVEDPVVGKSRISETDIQELERLYWRFHDLLGGSQVFEFYLGLDFSTTIGLANFEGKGLEKVLEGWRKILPQWEKKEE